ncbi:MAG: hypothetical protein ABI672_21385 [Vicinamibacteria bacterium]
MSADAVQAQSLASAAKKEQERRKTAAPAGTVKTYTETDLAAGRPASSDDEAPSTSAPATEPAVGVRTVAPDGAPAPGSEAYWRRRFAAARSAVTAAEGRVAQWERVGNRARANGAVVQRHDCSAQVADGKPGDRISIRTCPQTGTTTLAGELDAARAQLAAAQQALIDLESAARRGGAMPSWTR